MRASASDVGLVSVFQGSLLDYGKIYLSYHRSVEADRKDESCVGWFPYTHSSGEVLYFTACEVTSANRNAGGLQFKGFVRAVPVKFKPEPRRTVEEAQAASSAVYGPSFGFLDSSNYVLFSIMIWLKRMPLGAFGICR